MTEWIQDAKTGTLVKRRKRKGGYPSRDAEYRRAYQTVKYREDQEYRERLQEQSRARRRGKLVGEVPPPATACEICGALDSGWSKVGKRRALHLDHDHSTGAFRGWLCSRCNSGIGMFGDNPDLLMAAIAYLRARKGAK